jgi:hypothetical protein
MSHSLHLCWQLFQAVISLYLGSNGLFEWTDSHRSNGQTHTVRMDRLTLFEWTDSHRSNGQTHTVRMDRLTLVLNTVVPSVAISAVFPVAPCDRPPAKVAPWLSGTCAARHPGTLSSPTPSVPAAGCSAAITLNSTSKYSQSSDTKFCESHRWST